MGDNKFLYKQLYETIKNEIETGVLPEGSKLPPESETRARFGVSAITIKKAFSMLAEEGLVRRVPGKGTFVRGSAVVDAAASAPRPYNPRLIGMILEHVSTPFGLDLLYTVDRLLSEHGYKLCVRYSYGDRDRETEELSFLLSLGVVGLIIMPCHGNHYNTTLLRLIIDNFPIVLVDKKLEGIPVPSVRSDNAGATAMLVRHLHERGCRRIGLISLDAGETTSLTERRDGFFDEIDRLGLPQCPPCYVHVSQDLAENAPDHGIIEEMRAYLTENAAQLDAVITTEYGIVSCMTHAAEQAGVTLGRDGLRVCCIDEDYLAPTGYTFTHARQDERAMAACAVDVLLERIECVPLAQDDFVLPVQFRQGKTT